MTRAARNHKPSVKVRNVLKVKAQLYHRQFFLFLPHNARSPAQCSTKSHLHPQIVAPRPTLWTPQLQLTYGRRARPLRHHHFRGPYCKGIPPFPLGVFPSYQAKQMVFPNSTRGRNKTSPSNKTQNAKTSRHPTWKFRHHNRTFLPPISKPGAGPPVAGLTRIIPKSSGAGSGDQGSTRTSR